MSKVPAAQNKLVRSRFAPSPTGQLHLGSARTALFAWLYARHFGGEFILRIEDTDKVRSSKESVDAILNAMQWLNLSIDEGPIYQSDRTERYMEVVAELLASGKAYRCTCSKERLDRLRENQMKAGQKPKYDGHCRDANLGEDAADAVIRFKNPTEGKVEFVDDVKGLISISNQELDDFIILRSDGSPTYNFTVVVDDMDMEITHVVRGDDHINNTPKQINLFEALDYPLPIYAHVPTILGEDGKRLSKRHGATSVMEYKQQGILAHALLNYLLRLGFSYGDKEIFSYEEMIELFDPKRLNSAPASMNEKKLLWLNAHYLKEMDLLVLRDMVVELLVQSGRDVTRFSDADWELLLPLLQERCQTTIDMAQKAAMFFDEKVQYDAKASAKWLAQAHQPVLKALYDKLSVVQWDVSAIHDVFEAVAAELDLKLGKVAQPLRVAVTGNTSSPPLDVTCYLLGQHSVLERLQSKLIKQD